MTGGLYSSDSPARSELQADAEFWGIPLDLLEEPETEDGLWPEHAEAVEIFVLLSDFWRLNPRANSNHVFLGLDRVQAEAELRLSGIAVTPERWAEIRLIELGAVAALNGD